jgi:hypothetical protein
VSPAKSKHHHHSRVAARGSENSTSGATTPQTQ